MASWEIIHKNRSMRAEISGEDMYVVWMFGLHYHNCTWKSIRTFPDQIYFEMLNKNVKNRLGPILFYIGNAC